jgi:site-specific recombinase XerD
MAWQRNYVTLRSGERVRYSLIERPGSDCYLVRFKSAMKRWVERSTGTVNKVDATGEAHRIILEEYGQIAPTSATVPWEVAKAKLEEGMLADSKRLKTIKGYLETLDKLIVLFPLANGPADISDKMAEDFKEKYGRSPFTRKRRLKEGERAEEYARKAKSLDSRIRTLKAVFGWFKQMRLVEANPFEKITPPEVDRHEVHYVRQGDIAAFFTWLAERYPAWDMPRLFFSVQAVTACRLEDICSLRSEQLRERRLVFTADTAKTRSERYAILPTDLYAALVAYKGDTYLWERYPPELIAANKAKGWPTHRQNTEFSTRRLYLWVVQLMQAYQDQTGNDLSSHDFRRAAFTRAAEKNLDPKRAAVAFDVTAETMLRYYTATEKKRTADEILGELAGDLLPKKNEAGQQAADSQLS